MSQPANSMDSLTLCSDRPTELSFADLYRWVIWQFPRHKGGYFCGAVHPPSAETTWYPAYILVKQQRLLVYAHLGQSFDSPEAALEWLLRAEE